MKQQSILILLMFLFATNVSAKITALSDEESRQDEYVLTPEQEAQFYHDMYMKNLTSFDTSVQRFKFPQTKWLECSDLITGNYAGYACSDKRAISVALKKFMTSDMIGCVNQGLAAQGGGTTDDIHIEHNGILGDPNHSPRSLHAENRAIDIKAFHMKLKNGAVKKFVYENKSNKPFFSAFRKCWGKVIKEKNGCPLYKNNAELTASIGWEDSRHQHHLHTSVPYCVNGKYSSSYFQK